MGMGTGMAKCGLKAGDEEDHSNNAATRSGKGTVRKEKRQPELRWQIVLNP